MTERTVTEKQIIAAMNNNCTYKDIISELFPERPKGGELILCWDESAPYQKNWCYFVGISNDGRAIAIDDEGDKEPWDNYRRQTPAERGEG